MSFRDIFDETRRKIGGAIGNQVDNFRVGLNQNTLPSKIVKGAGEYLAGGAKRFGTSIGEAAYSPIYARQQKLAGQRALGEQRALENKLRTTTSPVAKQRLQGAMKGYQTDFYSPQRDLGVLNKSNIRILGEAGQTAVDTLGVGALKGLKGLQIAKPTTKLLVNTLGRGVEGAGYGALDALSRGGNKEDIIRSAKMGGAFGGALGFASGAPLKALKYQKIASLMDLPIPSRYSEVQGAKMYKPNVKTAVQDIKDFAVKELGFNPKVNNYQMKGKVTKVLDPDTGKLISWSTDNPNFARNVQEGKLTMGMSTRSVKPSEGADALSNEARTFGKDGLAWQDYNKRYNKSGTLTTAKTKAEYNGLQDVNSPIFKQSSDYRQLQDVVEGNKKIYWPDNGGLNAEIADLAKKKGLKVIWENNTPYISKDENIIKQFLADRPSGGKKMYEYIGYKPERFSPQSTQGSKSTADPLGTPPQESPVLRPDQKTPTPAENMTNAPSETPVSYDPNVPQNAADVNVGNTKERGFITSAKNSENVSADVKAGIEGTYEVASNKDTLNAAKTKIDEGFERAVHRAKSQENVDKSIQAESMLLVDQLQAMGRTQDAIEIVEKISERATTGGQATQILAAFNRLKPEGILLWAQKMVDKAKTNNPNAYGKLEIKPDQAEALRKMATDVQGMTGEAKADATRKLIEEVERLVPTPWAKKVTTLWKAGLLTGIKGAVAGNAVGNSMMAILKKVSDVPAAMLDNALALATGQRGKVFTLKGLLSGAWEGTKKGAKNLVKGVGAENHINKLDYQKVYFGKGKLGRAAQAYTDGIFNFYSAADRPFFHSALKNSLYDLATVQGKNQGLKGQALNDFVERLVKEPDDELLADATNAAEIVVFQNKNAVGAALSGFKQGLKRYGGSLGELVSEGVAPFTGVPSAIATALHNYSPSGLVTGVIDAIGSARHGNFDVAAQRKLSEAFGKAVTGTSLIFIGSALTKTGQMTLGYPTDEAERALWDAEGKTPYSIQVGGKWRSLNYTGPIMSLLAIGGEIEKAKQSGVTTAKSIVTGAIGSGKAILSSSPLQGMQGGMNALTDPQRYGDSYVNNQVASGIPTWVKDIAVAGDTTERQTNNVTEAVQNRIPILKNQLLPKRTFFGEEQQRKTSTLGSIFDPFRSSPAKTTPVVSELRRLQDTLGAKEGPTLSKQDKKVKAFGEAIELTPEQMDKFTEATGTDIKARFEKAMDTPTYRALSDEQKVKILNNIVSEVRTNASKNTVVNKGTDKLDIQSLIDKSKEAKEAGSTAPSRANKMSKTEIDMAKYNFENSDSNFQDLGGYVLRKNTDGTAQVQTKVAYNTQLTTQKMENAKTAKNLKLWNELAAQQEKNLVEQLNDPTLDELEKIELQQKYDKLLADAEKYSGYGGFTKGKAGKKFGGITLPTATAKIPIRQAKAPAFKNISKTPRIAIKTNKPKMISKSTLANLR